MTNQLPLMSWEIRDLYNKGYEPSDIINIIAERWDEKTFVVSYIVEYHLSRLKDETK